MHIKRISLEDIPHDIVLDAKRHRLILKNKENAVYFGGFVDNKLTCFTCLVLNKDKSASIKANYTIREYRRKGYFTMLNKYVLNYARQLGITTIKLNCLKSSLNIHLKQGARIWKVTKNLYWLVYDKGF